MGTTILPRIYALGYNCGYYVCALFTMMQNSYVIIQMDHYNIIRLRYNYIKSIPTLYKNWWIRLYFNDPTHVYIETTLILMIIYFLIINRTKLKTNHDNQQKQKLTITEEEELLQEWKEHIRQPLAPISLSSSSNDSSLFHTNSHMIVHKNNGRYLHGVMLLTNGDSIPATTITTTIPSTNASMSSTTTPSSPTRSLAAVVDEIVVNNENNNKMNMVLNFATFDFLGMSCNDPLSLIASIESSSTTTTSASNTTTIPALSSSPNDSKTSGSQDNDKNMVLDHHDATIAQQLPPSEAVVTSSSLPTPSPSDSMTTTTTVVNSNHSTKNPMKQAALDALDRYGCGSCGPRGFYGTVDVHLQFEEIFAQYMDSDDAILYSDGASTITSTIAAFCKRGDIVVVDECCYEPIMTGILLSRANVKLFKHNDIKDLESILQQIYESDIQLNRSSNVQRRFLIVEGLYKNTGQICPLNEIVKLKHQYHYRLMIDESYSFGTLGKHGKGCMELYNVKPMYDVEIVMLSIENSLGTIGGITVGKDDIIDHQRLSGSGYCFSASSPPFTAAFGIEAIQYLNQYNILLIQKLQSNIIYIYEQLNNMLTNDIEDLLTISSDQRSPIIMITLTSNIPETEILNENIFLREIVRECLCNSHIAMVVTGGSVSSSSTLSLNNGTNPTNALLKKTTTTSNTGKKVSYLDQNLNRKEKDNKNNTKGLSTKNQNNSHYRDPSCRIRMTVTVSHTKEDIDQAVTALRDAFDSVMYHLYTNNNDNSM